MNLIKKIWQFILMDTYGNIAMASFLICAVSGVFLAIPYDVELAYDSISLMLITNLPAVIFRNMHYWSAQFFLVFTFLHLLDHIKMKTAVNLRPGVWVALVISLMFVFFVMLSGFILKGDADSQQAYQILESLITRIPGLGKFMASLIFGSQGELQLIYVHHIATATIFLIYILVEHVGTLWTRRSTFLILLAVFTLLSFFLHAPLHDNINPVLKGPWYFVGLQEILHWSGRPGWVWLLVLFLLLLVYFSYYAGERSNRKIYYLLLILTFVYLSLTVIGFYFRGVNWQWKVPWEKNETASANSLEFGIRKVSSQFSELTASEIPLVQGKREACMTCHSNVTGFSPAHDPQAIGCTACHLGNPFSLDKTTAHKHMITIPGNLETANLSCGTINCHPEIEERIHRSLMTTNGGIISVDRFVFGESSTPDAPAHIQELGFSAADKHLRDLCANCHLGVVKQETGPVDELTRGGGCNACHLNYNQEGVNQHLAYIAGNKNENLLPQIHPSLDLNISRDHCFGCHSRSGRISTNYEGWHETLFDENDIPEKGNYRVLQDKRVFEYIADDIHHAAGMDCIDCHNSYEVMGDGNHYLHEEQAVNISCENCHFHEIPITVSYDELDLETKLIFDLRKFTHKDKIIVGGMNGEAALVNTYMNDDQAFMISKNSKNIHSMNPPASVCSREYGHKSLSCSSCHTAWAPSCIGCHNAFDENAQGYDLLDEKFVKGEWTEYVGEFIADAPTLGVRDGEDKLVVPAVPGMIMTIDLGSYQGSPEEEILFHRLFAPVAPHTTSAKGRNCSSCHSNPVALGYGRGKLVFVENGQSGFWSFIPSFANNKYDGLPEDAWIPFKLPENMEEASDKIYSTRTDFRPFNANEQKTILRVGVCLHCHDDHSAVMLNSLKEDFSKYLEKISDQCILPPG